MLAECFNRWGSLLVAATVLHSLSRAATTLALNTDQHRFVSPFPSPPPVSDTTWTSLGPFPVGTRESYLLRPLVAPFDDQYPSTLVDGGFIKPVEGVQEDLNGWVQVIDDPEQVRVRWKELRQYGGWGVLQHERVYARMLNVEESGTWSFTLTGAVSFSINPKSGERSWFNGDLYDPKDPPPHLLQLSAGTHEVVVLYAYDVRVSGDPPDGVPKARWRLLIEEVEEKDGGWSYEVAGKVVPDVVEGWLMGDVLGVEVRNFGSDKVLIENVVSERDEIDAQISKVTLYPHQTRLVAISIRQTFPLDGVASSLAFTLKVSSPERVNVMHTKEVVFPLIHTPYSPSAFNPFLSTFLSNTQTPTYSLYTPPLSPSLSPTSPAILALHGAGVDPATARDFWTSSIPPRERNWIVWPLGLTEWGYDWHGASLRDARLAVEHLGKVEKLWKWVTGETGTSQKSTERRKVLVMGHSNGGQGTWHYLSHFPDEVIGGVPASGFVKIQDYVPYTFARGHHFRDPLLTGILTSSLTSFDNDLYTSNLVGIPILSKHGANDDNVPVYHSRQMVASVRTWSQKSNITPTISYSEVPDRGHWFDDVFNDPLVLDFVNNILKAEELGNIATQTFPDTLEFTMTCANPDEMGSKHGFRIMELDIPGRLARLQVTIYQDVASSSPDLMVAELKAINVRTLSFDPLVLLQQYGVTISSVLHRETLLIPPSGSSSHYEFSLSPTLSLSPAFSSTLPRRYGPLISILSTSSPIKLVLGTSGSVETFSHLREIALKIARDAYVYGKVDCEILEDREIVNAGSLEGNVVLLGGATDNSLTRKWGVDWAVDVKYLGRDAFAINGTVFQTEGQGLLYLAPNPMDPESLTLVLSGIGHQGLESASRLFPVRTGVTVPDWVVTSPEESDGGVAAAGFWGADWRFNPEISYLP